MKIRISSKLIYLNSMIVAYFLIIRFNWQLDYFECLNFHAVSLPSTMEFIDNTVMENFLYLYTLERKKLESFDS